MARLGHASFAADVTVMISLCLLLCSGDVIHARRPVTYIVGEKDGWGLDIPMYTWPRGKTFYAGDILVFNYDPQDSNVVAVNRTAYEKCQPNDGAKEYDSGHDRIQLAYGSNYFIGTYNPDDCPAGLKMAVKALAPKTSDGLAPERSN